MERTQILVHRWGPEEGFQRCSAERLKGAVQLILFNFANHSPSIAMELKVSKEITGK